jgi:hypothetical protein
LAIFTKCYRKIGNFLKNPQYDNFCINGSIRIQNNDFFLSIFFNFIILVPGLLVQDEVCAAVSEAEQERPRAQHLAAVEHEAQVRGRENAAAAQYCQIM